MINELNNQLKKIVLRINKAKTKIITNNTINVHIAIKKTPL